MKKINYLLISLLSLNSVFIFSTQAMENEETISYKMEKLFCSIETLKNRIPTCQETAILFLGHTGSGKSSLLTYLVDPSFVFAEKNSFDDYIIRSVAKIPLNTSNSNSRTLLPTNWKEYWDFPGFCSYDSVQDIENAFSIYNVSKNSKRIKILLISSETTLREQKSTEFLKIIHKVGDIFKDNDFNQLAKSLCLVVTKNKKLDLIAIQDKLRLILKEQSGSNNFTPSQEKIIETLTSPEAKIVFFNAPQQVGNISNNDRVLILDAINQISYLENPQPAIHLSAESQIFLNDWKNFFISDISVLIADKFKRGIIDYCQNSIKDHSSTAQSLREYFGAFLTKLTSISFDPQDFKNTLQKFFNITKNHLKNKILEAEFSKKTDQFQFIKFLNPSFYVDKDYSIGWSRQISQFIKHLSTLASSPVIERHGDFLTLNGFIIGTSDLNVAMRKHQEICEANVYSLNSLFIDSDINAPGINLTLISPYWRVVEERIISLKGTDGLHHTDNKGKDGFIDDSYNHISGENGLSGLPGYNGGHFYGNGKFFDGLSYLTIDVSGGNGGPGQNGGNGAIGANGQNGNLQDVKDRKKSALKERKLVEAESWRDYAEKAAKFLLTFNGKFEETYETGTLGRIGGNGGQGGIGGLGGNPGSVVIENQRNLRTVICSHGNRGTDGKAGEPGLGGKNGERYRGVYINEVIAPRIRGYQPIENISILAEIVKVGVESVGMGLAAVTTETAIVNKRDEAVVTVGTSTMASSFKLGIGGIGAILASQTMMSLISSYFSSGWKSYPIELNDEPYAQEGRKPVLLNHNGIKSPFLNLNIFISSDEKKISYDILCKNSAENPFVGSSY